jgi:DNA polymerase phi
VLLLDAKMTVTTTLPLFWELASPITEQRIDASVELIGVLEDFQAKFKSERLHANGIAEAHSEESGSDVDADDDNKRGKASYYALALDRSNAPDVAYAIRRLVRGLASPRESSRLGFAVALTEVSSRPLFPLLV